MCQWSVRVRWWIQFQGRKKRRKEIERKKIWSESWSRKEKRGYQYCYYYFSTFILVSCFILWNNERNVSWIRNEKREKKERKEEERRWLLLLVLLSAFWVDSLSTLFPSLSVSILHFIFLWSSPPLHFMPILSTSFFLFFLPWQRNNLFSLYLNYPDLSIWISQTQNLSCVQNSACLVSILSLSLSLSRCAIYSFIVCTLMSSSFDRRRVTPRTSELIFLSSVYDCPFTRITFSEHSPSIAIHTFKHKYLDTHPLIVFWP